MELGRGGHGSVLEVNQTDLNQIVFKIHGNRTELFVF
jgi:hypothetical protein